MGRRDRWPQGVSAAPVPCRRFPACQAWLREYALPAGLHDRHSVAFQAIMCTPEAHPDKLTGMPESARGLGRGTGRSRHVPRGKNCDNSATGPHFGPPSVNYLPWQVLVRETNALRQCSRTSQGRELAGEPRPRGLEPPVRNSLCSKTGDTTSVVARQQVWCACCPMRPLPAAAAAAARGERAAQAAALWYQPQFTQSPSLPCMPLTCLPALLLPQLATDGQDGGIDTSVAAAQQPGSASQPAQPARLTDCLTD